MFHLMITVDQITFCRHCRPVPFARTYASVLVLGEKGADSALQGAPASIRSAIEKVEAEGIVPCLTAVCPECGQVTALMVEGCCDPHVHVLGVWRRLGPWLL